MRGRDSRKDLNCTVSFKLGCVVRMVVDSILPQAECGPNDHRKDAPLFSPHWKLVRFHLVDFIFERTISLSSPLFIVLKVYKAITPMIGWTVVND